MGTADDVLAAARAVAAEDEDRAGVAMLVALHDEDRAPGPGTDADRALAAELARAWQVLRDAAPDTTVQDALAALAHLRFRPPGVFLGPRTPRSRRGGRPTPAAATGTPRRGGCTTPSSPAGTCGS